MNLTALHGSVAAIAVVTALGTASMAAAQAVPIASPTPATPDDAPAASPTAQPDAGIGDIIVTAQRRSEGTQRTPIAISVVAPAALQASGITTLANLSRLVPAIQIVQSAGATPIYFIRGVGSLTGNSFTDPAVSLNYDGVALARQYQGNGQFYDLERVEVLRGPQGTLYGRNATGGVLNILPQTPVLRENLVSASILGGNYATIDADAAINIALGDTAALRIAGQTADHDGYLSDGEQDEKGRSIRAQLLLKPSTGFSIRIGGDYHHQGGIGGGYALVDQSTFVYPTGAARITPADRVGYGSTRGQLYYSARGRGTPTDPVNPHMNNDFYGFNAHIDADLGFATLTVIPAYRRTHLDYYAINSFSLAYDEKDDQASVEARLSSKEHQRFRWILGGFGLTDSSFTIYNNDNYNKTGSRSNYRLATKSYAAFADGTFDLTGTLRVLGGIRYTHDNKTAVGRLTNLAGTGGIINLSGDRDFSATNYRAGLQFDVAPRVMLYGTVATGYHAGGFYFSEIVNPGDANTYDPERITAYTVGAKTQFFDRRLQFNVEAFRWELKGQQISFTTQDSLARQIFRTLNAGSSTNQGVEVEIQAKPTRTTTLEAQIQYLDAKFNSLVYTQALALQPGFLCASSGAAPRVVIDCSGKRPPQAPEWGINLSGDQTVPLGAAGELVAGVRAHYQSETVVGFNYLIDDVQKGVWNEDATLTYNAPGRRWSLGGFINNISDEVIKSNATHNGNIQAFQIRPPRTYGVRASISFR